MNTLKAELELCAMVRKELAQMQELIQLERGAGFEENGDFLFTFGALLQTAQGYVEDLGALLDDE